MTTTFEFDFEDLVFEGLTHDTEYKKSLMSHLNFILDRGYIDDEEESAQLNDVIKILGGTVSNWDEARGCWVIRVLFSGEEIEHDTGNVIERIVDGYSKEFGDLTSEKTWEILNKGKLSVEEMKAYAQSCADVGYDMI